MIVITNLLCENRQNAKKAVRGCWLDKLILQINKDGIYLSIRSIDDCHASARLFRIVVTKYSVAASQGQVDHTYSNCMLGLPFKMHLSHPNIVFKLFLENSLPRQQKTVPCYLSDSILISLHLPSIPHPDLNNDHETDIFAQGEC